MIATPTNPYQSPESTDSTVSSSTNTEFTDLGEIASAWTITARLIRQHWWVLVLIYALVQVPLSFLISYVGRDAESWDELSQFFRIQQAGEFWIGSIASGALVAAALAALDQQPIEITMAYGTSLHRYGKLLTTQIVFNLLLIIGLLLFIVPGIIFAVRTTFITSIAVHENAHGPTAVRRCFELTQGHFRETAFCTAAILGVYLTVIVGYTLLMGAIVVANETLPSPVITEDQLWLCEAVLSLIFAVPSVFGAVLATSQYRRLSEVSRVG